MPTRIVALISLLTISAVAAAKDKSGPARISKLEAQLNRALQCPERLWPGLKKDVYRVLFVRPSRSEAWLWTGSSGQMRALNESEYNPVAEVPRYAFGQYGGEKTIIINLDLTSTQSPVKSLGVDGAVGLSIHEGFHYLFQMKEPWVAMFASSDRRSDVDHAAATYARRMLIRSLKTDLISGGKFGHSSFWYHAWETTGEGPETKLSDVMEGTAHYVELMASIIAANGCRTSEADLLNTAVSNLDALGAPPLNSRLMRQIFRKYLATGYQLEGYEIGLLSLLALRQRGHLVGVSEYEMGRDFVAEIQSAGGGTDSAKVIADLQVATARVRTPAELLLGSITPVADAEDRELRKLIYETMNNAATRR